MKLVKTGLAGYPIAHSLSPLIHNAAYQYLGLNWHYDLYPCASKQEFLQLLARLVKADSGFIGLNVTTPWKQEAYKENNHAASKIAQAAQAANVLTVKSDSKSLSCANTDGKGIVAALQQNGTAIAGSQALICGTGAVAAVTLLELINGQAAQIMLCSRESSRAALLSQAIMERSGKLAEQAPSNILTVSYYESKRINEFIISADFIIDATTVGTKQQAAAVISTEHFKPGQVVFDVNYGHGLSALLQGALAKGALALDGLQMLVEQAALSIEIWAKQLGFELSAPRELMHQVARRQF